MDNVSYGRQDPDNETDKLGRFWLGGTTINWIMKCYLQGGIT